MITYITELILIEKHHLISLFEGVVSPNNVIVSNSCLPTRMKFVRRRCNWFYNEARYTNGFLVENVIEFSFSQQQEQVKKWCLDNEDRDFVAFIQLRNGTNYIVGDKNIGLSLEFRQGISVENIFNVFLTGLCESQAVNTDFQINDFFVGRDFGDDFNIDFG